MAEHPNLASALVAALSELTTIDTDRSANMGSYSYKYADLGDIVRESRPKLAEHGIVALTPLGAHDDDLAVSVILLHTSGERMDFGPFPFPHGRDAQATGSMVTYHRRYALLAALGMATGDDDDGVGAVPRQAKQEPTGNASCGDCGEVVPGARNDKEPMREHKIAAHGWVRQDDGTVAPPFKPDPEMIDHLDESASKRAERAAQVAKEAGLTERAEALRAKAAEKEPEDRKVAASGGGS